MTQPQFPRRAHQVAGGELTPAQFHTLARLMRSTEPVRTAARLVLVDGLRPTDAAEGAGVSIQSCSNAVARMKRAHALILEAYK